MRKIKIKVKIRSLLIKLDKVSCMRCIVLIILLWIVVVYHLRSKTIRVEKTPGLIYMLTWTPSTTEPFDFMGIGVETFIKRNCPVTNCYVTGNRKLLGDITNFDVILFHGKEVIKGNASDMPEQRSRKQIYVFASMESAGYYPVPPIIYDGYFNLTWTYKLDSDIYFGYLAIKNRNGEIIGPSENINWLSNKDMLPIEESVRKRIINKRIAAAWFVSNCKTPSKRLNLVEQIHRELKHHGMSVDVYGECGDLKCPRSAMYNCLKLLQTDYYFYFAFENSFAEDYVTEKLLYALNHYTVPVVFGGAKYKRFMPDGAYLDATKLSPQELAKQMIKIINNPQRYYDFFKWRNHYSYHALEKSSDTDPFCKLCEYINRMITENTTKVMNNFENWWNPHAEQWIRFYSNDNVK